MITKIDIKKLARPNVLKMKPYASARIEYTGVADLYLDANENPFETGMNRYPDPLQKELKLKIGNLKNIHSENIFLGNGSDEVIDLLIRIFCNPKQDHIITLPPTYGMYQVSAALSDVLVKKIPLRNDFQPDVEAILKITDVHSKILFLCSPNNPTGNSFSFEIMKTLIQKFPGIVVVDEAYIDFAKQQSCLSFLEQFPNLVVAQTFSKAWGLAGIRLGIAFASTTIIQLLNKVKPPYNINCLTQRTALKALAQISQKTQNVNIILQEREKLTEAIANLNFVKEVFPSDANFVLVKMEAPKDVYQFLLDRKIIVRDRSNVLLCEGCLRISIGTPAENQLLISTLKSFK